MPLPHLGILCLTEILKKEYDIDVEALDGDFDNLNDDKILNKILKSKPGIIGFSPFQFSMERTIGLIKKIKSKLPQTTIILGGVHASLTAVDILTDIAEVDYIIKGEAEISFPTLLLTLLQLKNTDFATIEGLAYRQKGEIIENKASFFPNLDALPNLGIPQLAFTNEICLVSSRGCVSNCSFCCTPNFMKLSGNSKYRFQSAEKVFNDISQIIQKSENKEISIYFPDSDFLGLNNITLERANKIADYILTNNITVEIKLACQAKAIVKAGIEFWKKLKKAGLTMVYCGFESGSEEDLAFYNKSSNVNDGIEAYRILSECNIGLHIGFIMFNPYSNKEKLIENIKFLKDIDELHIYGNISREVSAYPCTKIFSELEKEKLLCYDKPYVTPLIKYNDKTIEEIKNALCSNSREQMLIDFTCYKFDYAIGCGKGAISFSNYYYQVNNDLSKKYGYYKKERANIVEYYATKIIDSCTENLTDAADEMNGALLKAHQEFLSGIRNNYSLQTQISIQLHSVVSFLKSKFAIN